MAKRKKVDDAVSSGSTLERNEAGNEGVFANPSPSPVDGLASPKDNDPVSDVAGANFSTITIKLSPSGSIDIGGMRARTLDKLKGALQATPEILPGYGEMKLDGSSVPDFMVNAVYQLVGGIEQWVFAKKYGENIATIMAYSPADIAVLSDPTKAVLAKHLPKLGKFQEETALVMALASIHIGKVAAMNAALARQQEQRPDVTEIQPATQATQ